MSQLFDPVYLKFVLETALMKQVLSVGKRNEKILGSCMIKSQTQSTCKIYRKMEKGTNAGIPFHHFVL